MGGKNGDSLADIVAKGMSEFGQLDESTPALPNDSEPTNLRPEVFATQETKQLIKPQQSVETRTSWVIPAKSKAPPQPSATEATTEEIDAVAGDANSTDPENTIAPQDETQHRPAPTSGDPDWQTSFTPPEPEPVTVVEPEPPKPRIVKPANSTDLGVEW